MADSGTDTTRFVHLSDAHIGHRQYSLKKRRDDMYMSFNSTILEAIDQDVDFAVLSGDLFHNKNVNALALSDAVKGFEKLNDAGIPVIAIEGNHDSNLYKEDLTWLQYLHAREHIVLLECDATGDGPRFEKHDFNDPGTSSGYVDIDGIRIFGMEWLGQRTADHLEAIADAIREVNHTEGEPQYTVLLGHFGIEGHIPAMSGGISYNQLEPLEDIVDYLGLGHLHKKYSHENWVYNPGSLEAHDTREAQWDHGYHIVETGDENLTVEFNRSKCRPFYRISFQVEDHDSFADLEAAFTDALEEELPKLRQVQQQPHHMGGDQTREPVIDLHLEGLLEFSRSQLDIDRLEELVDDRTDALYVNLSDATESKETASILQELDEGEDEIRDEDGQIDRGKLEVAVFEKLANQDSRYDMNSEDVAEALASVKRGVLADESPESVADTIKQRRRELFPRDGGDN